MASFPTRAKVVVIDPRRTGVAARADLHLALLPGTDVVLAYAIANRWQQRGEIRFDLARQRATGVDEFLAAAAEWTLDRAAGVTGLAAADAICAAEAAAAHLPGKVFKAYLGDQNSPLSSAARQS